MFQLNIQENFLKYSISPYFPSILFQRILVSPFNNFSNRKKNQFSQARFDIYRIDIMILIRIISILQDRS